MEQVTSLRWKESPQSQKVRDYIANIAPGTAYITRAKRVNYSEADKPKIQIEFVEKLDLSQNSRAAIALFNTDDDRFSTGATHAWMTASVKDAKAKLGVEIPEGKDIVEILKPAPALVAQDGSKLFLRIQYTEVFESQLNDSQKEYVDNYLKRAGMDGPFLWAKNPFSGQTERVASLKRVNIVKEGEEGPKPTMIQGTYSEVNPVLAGQALGAVASQGLSSEPAIHSDVSEASN